MHAANLQIPRCLISVRDAAESLAALHGGADIIDIKEPLAGPLGAAKPDVWRQVFSRVGGEVPVSAALGELVDLNFKSFDVEIAKELQGLAFAKVGLANCRDIDWRSKLREMYAAFPADTEPVAVVYADYLNANSPCPIEIVNFAIDCRVPTILWDTFAKGSSNLLHSDLPEQRWLEALSRAKKANVDVALAGSLTAADLFQTLDWSPDILAFRGAACNGDREQKICSERVSELVETIGKVFQSSAEPNRENG